jgi:hypothetical protein
MFCGGSNAAPRDNHHLRLPVASPLSRSDAPEVGFWQTLPGHSQFDACGARSSVSFDRPLPCESTPEIMVH